MRIYVMCDLEGTAGVINHRLQCWTDGAYYQQARRLATLELNALVEGALAGGATEVVAWDGHGGFPGGLEVELLHPACELEMGSGDGGPQAIDASFAAAMQLGMHAMAGTAQGPLAHSFNLHYRRLLLNGQEFGECAMNCLMAGEHGVPTVLLVGDDAAAAEAQALVPAVETVVVKHGLSQTACISLAPERARQLIRLGAERAVRRVAEIPPYRVTPPYHLRVEYRAEKHADDILQQVPAMRRIDATTVEMTAVRLGDLRF